MITKSPGGSCKVCHAPNRAEIEDAWANYKIKREDFSKTFGINQSTVFEHFRDHVKKKTNNAAKPRPKPKGIVYNHPERAEIEKAWILKTCPKGEWFDRYGITYDDIYNHQKRYLSKADKELIYLNAKMAVAADEVEADKINVVATITKLSARAEKFLDQAEHDKDLRGGVAVLAELRKQVSLFAQVVGKLEGGPSQILEKSPEWIKVRDILLEVFEKHPAAKVDFLAKIGRLSIG